MYLGLSYTYAISMSVDCDMYLFKTQKRDYGLFSSVLFRSLVIICLRFLMVTLS